MSTATRNDADDLLPSRTTRATRPPTVHDVARRAGVSAQTVSRMLTGFEGIRPATRAKVQAAIDALNYRPNNVARLLRTRRSNRIGVVVHEMFEFGPAGLLRGASARARDAGYSLTIVGVDGDDERSIDEALDGFEQDRVAGILAITLTDSVRAAVERRITDIPILVDPAEAHFDGPSMNEAGAAAIASHFISLGHRRVAMIAGPQSWLPARQRRNGFVDAIRGAGGVCVRVWPGDWSAACGSAAARELDETDGITAVFAANDATAMGFLHGARQRGLNVPQDLAVAGFDDAPDSSFLTPTLTTVRPNYAEQGRIAIDTLLSESRQPRALVDFVSSISVITRESTAARN